MANAVSLIEQHVFVISVQY